jgi:hypothetical protein
LSLLHYVSNAVKPRTFTGWYDPLQDQPNACTGRVSLDCYEYPFFSTAEGGPDGQRAEDSPQPRLAPTDTYENRTIEGSRLGYMYGSCQMQSGTEPGDKSKPESEYLVIPIPLEELGVPTGYLC